MLSANAIQAVLGGFTREKLSLARLNSSLAFSNFAELISSKDLATRAVVA